MKKTRWITIILGWMIWLVWRTSLPTLVNAQSRDVCLSWNKQKIAQQYIWTVTLTDHTLADLLIVDTSYPKERFAIVTQFCDSILRIKKNKEHNEKEVCFENGGYLYDPRQSLFVYSLCANMDKRSDIPKHIWQYKDHFALTYKDRESPVDIQSFLKDIDLNTIWWIPKQSTLDNPLINHSCDPKWPLGKNPMQSCNFSKIIAQIMENVMNDYTNFATAAIFGYRYWVEEEQREKAIKEFVERYFNGNSTDINSPCNDPNIQYIQKTPTTFPWNKEHCGHPKTYKMLDDTIIAVHKLVKDAKLLDREKVYETECTFSDPGSAPQSLHACAFSSTWKVFTQTSREVFKNLMLNEIFYYEFFVDFYTSSLAYGLHYNPPINQNLTLFLQNNNNEVRTALQDKQMMRNAVFQTTRLLWQVYALYPIHIWLSAYYEDLIIYRNKLVAIYTPLHQLFTSLLRNAQEKK
jgi:hypothetical protein